MINESTLCFEQGPIRPPNEARSLLLRITRNCPWNQCLFCPVYKKEKFSLRTIEEIKKDIPKTAQAAGVDIIVGKWDIVYKRPSAKVIDITNQLVEIFDPDEETLEKIKALLEYPPVPAKDLENMKCEPPAKNK